jgi:hypothetical protein
MKRFNEVRLRANKEVFNPAGLNLLDPTAYAFLFVGPLHSSVSVVEEY